MHTSTKQSADEIKTRIKEAEQYEKESDAKHRLFKPNPTNAMIDYAENSTNHFARGNTFYKLFWIFFIGCFAGHTHERAIDFYNGRLQYVVGANHSGDAVTIRFEPPAR